MNMRRTIAIRFSEEEVQTARSLAEKQGLEFSDYVRKAATGQIAPESEKLELLKQIDANVKKLLKK